MLGAAAGVAQHVLVAVGTQLRGHGHGLPVGGGAGGVAVVVADAAKVDLQQGAAVAPTAAVRTPDAYRAGARPAGDAGACHALASRTRVRPVVARVHQRSDSPWEQRRFAAFGAVSRAAGPPGTRGWAQRGPAPMPASRARATASARSATCSLPKTFETWFRTVLSLTTSRRAIAAFVSPRATRSRISRSRSVSSGKGVAVPAPPRANQARTREASVALNTTSPFATVSRARAISCRSAPFSR